MLDVAHAPCGWPNLLHAHEFGIRTYAAVQLIDAALYCTYRWLGHTSPLEAERTHIDDDDGRNLVHVRIAHVPCCAILHVWRDSSEYSGTYHLTARSPESAGPHRVRVEFVLPVRMFVAKVNENVLRTVHTFWQCHSRPTYKCSCRVPADVWPRSELAAHGQLT